MSNEPPFHIAKSLEYGWDVLSKRWIALVLWTVIMSVPHLMINTATWIFALFAQDHQSPWYLKFISVAVHVLTYLLYTRVVLLCMDDEPAGIGDVLGGLKFLIPFALASLFFSLLVVPGLFLLFIPGIYLGLRLGMYSFLVVDQYMGPIEALKRSWAITGGHLKMLAGLYFVLAMVVFGGMICFVIGVIPASIVSTVALASVYRRLDQAFDTEDDDENAEYSDNRAGRANREPDDDDAVAG